MSNKVTLLPRVYEVTDARNLATLIPPKTFNFLTLKSLEDESLPDETHDLHNPGYYGDSICQGDKYRLALVPESLDTRRPFMFDSSYAADPVSYPLPGVPSDLSYYNMFDLYKHLTFYMESAHLSLKGDKGLITFLVKPDDAKGLIGIRISASIPISRAKYFMAYEVIGFPQPFKLDASGNFYAVLADGSPAPLKSL